MHQQIESQLLFALHEAHPVHQLLILVILYQKQVLLLVRQRFHPLDFYALQLLVNV